MNRFHSRDPDRGREPRGVLSREELREALPHALEAVELPYLGGRRQGKVRDLYPCDGRWLLVATDRMSAFDRVLGLVPYKGQVLNQLSAWWFERTRDLVDNHLVSVPDPNVTMVRKAEPLPVEVVVRGYITGVTRTSLWTLYSQGERCPYGVSLPEGLEKNDPLPEPILTPTTKEARDRPLTSREIREEGLVEPSLWDRIAEISRALFFRGQEVAREGGLILVDTKYEFGLVEGRLMLIDEIHTPDSSRFWVAGTEGEEPEHLDKEFLRMACARQGYRGEGPPPPLEPELAVEVARRYLEVWERLTGETFVPGEQPAAPRIARNLQEFARR